MRGIQKVGSLLGVDEPDGSPLFVERLIADHQKQRYNAEDSGVSQTLDELRRDVRLMAGVPKNHALEQ